MAVTIREMDADDEADRAGVRAIDTSFETRSVFDVVVDSRRIELVERALAAPLVKRYSIGEVFAEWARWDDGWVAVDDAGVICGFAAASYEPWHTRLVLWHLYVSPASRRSGVGRALLAQVEAHGRARRATHVWLETSSVNVPGFAAYARLGYTLCGADVFYYGDYMPGEQALYLAKPLTR